jgi:hypothetical protein
MKQHKSTDTDLVWPMALAAALLGMLVFMIVVDPAAEQPVTSATHSGH